MRDSLLPWARFIQMTPKQNLFGIWALKPQSWKHSSSVIIDLMLVTLDIMKMQQLSLIRLYLFQSHLSLRAMCPPGLMQDKTLPMEKTFLTMMNFNIKVTWKRSTYQCNKIKILNFPKFCSQHFYKSHHSCLFILKLLFSLKIDKKLGWIKNFYTTQKENYMHFSVQESTSADFFCLLFFGTYFTRNWKMPALLFQYESCIKKF